jgi:hypothetical protein
VGQPDPPIAEAATRPTGLEGTVPRPEVLLLDALASLPVYVKVFPVEHKVRDAAGFDGHAVNLPGVLEEEGDAVVQREQRQCAGWARLVVAVPLHSVYERAQAVAEGVGAVVGGGVLEEGFVGVADEGRG